MRHIHLAEGLRLQFPRRTEEFDQGVEIGMIAMLMDLGTQDFTRWISTANLELTRSLAKKMGYHLVEGPTDTGLTKVTLRVGRARPKLQLVHSRDGVLPQEVASREVAPQDVAPQVVAPSAGSRLIETTGP